MCVAEPSTAPFSEPVGINPATKTASINSPLHQYGQYLTTCLPKYVQQFSVYKDELTLYVPSSAIVQTLTFLRDHSQCQYSQVMDITAVDYPTKPMRFEVRNRCCRSAELTKPVVDCLQSTLYRASVAYPGQNVCGRGDADPFGSRVV